MREWYRSWLTVINLGLVAFALGASIVPTFASGQGRPASHPLEPSQEAASARRPSAQELTDSTGALVKVRPYRRIVGASLVADRLLLELAEPERVIAALESSRATPWGYRLSAPHTISGITQVERLLELRPDLVLVNDLGDTVNILRLRALGLEAFALGEMRGKQSLLRNIEQVAALLQVPERGQRLAEQFERRQQSLQLPAGAPRLRGLYVSVHGDKLYGGTRHTSYSDVLVAAGLVDAAAERYEGWPRYVPEQLLLLDPDVIVTTTRSRGALCSQPGLHRLKACASAQGFVELEPGLISDPGLAMADAAELIHEAVYGGAR
jgi:iron complex transport system substrate-binding protein